LCTFGKRVSLTSRRTLEREGQIRDVRAIEVTDRCCNTTYAYANSVACTSVANRALYLSERNVHALLSNVWEWEWEISITQQTEQ
jgi:hypothetical protein